MAIYLGLPSPAGSSDLPESRRAALCFLFGLASDGVYICPSCYQEGGSLLHCPSNLTGRGRRYISVALSLESPPPDVIRHPAQRRGHFADEPFETETIEGYIDGHNIDFLKNRVAFDLEWNSKDQTFDRDLLAMRTYFDCGLIDVGIIVTRAEELNEIFKQEKDENGQALIRKYGASTTWMGKLRYRLDSRRNGGCPILAIGIGKECVEEYGRLSKYHTELKRIYEGEEV